MTPAICAHCEEPKYDMQRTACCDRPLCADCIEVMASVDRENGEAA